MAGKTRQRIMDAAIACYTERGVAATTVEHLRERSGASTGSIYHHFGSKEELAVAVYTDGLMDYQSSAIDALERATDARGAVVGVVRNHLAWVEANPELAKFLLDTRQAEYMGNAEDGIKAKNKDFVRRVVTWIRAAVDAGELREMPLDLYLPLLLGPCHEFVRHYLAGRMRTSLSEAADGLAEAAWRSLSPKTLESPNDR